MMNSPWARLITFISPKDKANPSAVSSRIELRLRPLKSCSAQTSIIADFVGTSELWSYRFDFPSLTVEG